jgi:hypothetical protein
LSEARRQWSDDIKAYAGVVIGIDHNGELACRYGLIRPDQAERLKGGGAFF